MSEQNLIIPKGEFGFIYSTLFLFFWVHNFEVFNLLSLIIHILPGNLFGMKGKKEKKFMFEVINSVLTPKKQTVLEKIVTS